MTLSLVATTVLAAALAVVVFVALRLRRDEARFRQLVEGADDVVFRTDGEGRFVYANPATRELVGVDAKTLVGRPFLDVVRPDYREQARRFYEDQRQTAPMSSR